MSEYAELERFATRLRMLKERAGHSYEALALKSGISRSSLHRYCAGLSLPQDYGAAHRVATACGATAAELRELHRLWALADVERAPRSVPEPPQNTRETSAETGPDDTTTALEAAAPEPPPAEAPHRAAAPTQPEPPAAGGGRRLLKDRRLVVVAAVAAVLLVAAAYGASFGTWPLGSAEPDEQRLLFSASCQPVVGMGQHDACVREVQRLLRWRGADIDVDSDFGPQTLRRVTAFQVLAGLPANGVVGADTKKALYESKVRLNVWSPEKIRERVREVFNEVPNDALAIADCQSFLDPLYVLPNTNGTRNWGLFQISDGRLRELGGTPRKALDPEWNIQAALRLWSRKHDFHDWAHCERALHPTSSASASAAAR
ncbi:helix-turn-helix domain-containing protein [Streptomyces sp. NPDC051677]|uniref:helix-turn-helix domain-containing protein n=1 Tax=Streptomyces sp. NPDC051677 TaxID=3365669 RepID=UPI0037D49824